MKLNEVDTKAGLNKAFQLAKDNESKYDRSEMWNVYLSGIQVGLASSPSHEGISNEESKEAFEDVMKNDIDRYK